MSLPVALQLYSVREDIDKDLIGTLKVVKEMGYDGVETVGLYDLHPQYLRGICDALGLAIVSSHTPYVWLAENPEKWISDLAEAGCKYVAYPYMDLANLPGGENWDKVRGEFEKIGKIAVEHGVQMLYHNHDFELTNEVNGVPVLDTLLAEFLPEILADEPDTCWLKVAGKSPEGYIEKYAGRCPVVHLKDFYRETAETTGKLYDLVGKESDDTGRGKGFEFRPFGSGMQNIAPILEASEKFGAEWVVVEQDEPSGGMTALESAKESRENLRKLGW